MALKNYGVLRGHVDTFKREDNDSSPHLQIKVIDGHNQAWRVPVNVLSGDHSLLVYHLADPLLSVPVLNGLSGLASGFTLLPPASRSAMTSLDYLRSPLFDWINGVALPPTGPGANDDLQDRISTLLTRLKAQNGELFVFGDKWTDPVPNPHALPIDKTFNTHQGVHDVHLNQGNPNPGSFAKDNGVFQDGGLILKFPTRSVGIFLRFQTELLPTDDVTGHPAPGAKPVPAGSGPGGNGVPPPPITNPPVYIERALVNPAGDDAGKEAVVIGNTTTAAVDLTGWSIVDKNNHADTIAHVQLPAGESHLVLLTGAGAQLGNNGGTIRLRDKTGAQVHAVSYSSTDAAEQGRYIRFNM